MKKKEENKDVYIKPEIKEIGDVSKLTKSTSGPNSDGLWGRMTAPVS